MHLTRLTTLLALFLLFLAGTAHAGDERAPFTGARFVEKGVEIEVDDTWYLLRSLDGIPADKILDHAREAFPEKWQKRFTEDLEEVMAGIDHRCGPTVKLELEKLDDGAVITLPRVSMTEEKRRDARNTRRGRPKSPRSRKKKDDDFAKLAPFTGVRFPENGPEARVDGTWYRLVAIDGIKAPVMVVFAKKQYGGRWAKRFGEDLVQVMTEMGYPPGATVDLLLEDLETGKRIEKPKVAMTKENRRSVWIENTPDKERGPARRVQRKHSGKVAPGYGDLALHVEGNALGKDQTLTRAQAEQDLDELEWHVVHHFSYRDLRGVEVQAAFDSLRSGLPAKITRNAFAIRVIKLLALFGDAHSRVSENPSRIYAAGYLPFLLVDASQRLAAIQPDRSGFLDAEHPYLTHIDGAPVAEWLAAAARISHRGSPQLLRRASIRNLRYLQQVRRELGRPEIDRVTVQVEDEMGTTTRELTIDVAPRPPIYGTWPRTKSRILDGGIGYLRIPSMMQDAGKPKGQRELLHLVDIPMGKYRETGGLIIDVRGNGGGTRDALRRLFPYFLTAKDGARVANVAKYRLHEGDDRNAPDGFLSNRSLFPLAYPRWTETQRAAVRKASETFEPEWTPRDEEFSAWHYMAIEHGSNPAAYHYDKPVVVLIDSNCFSATDIFVGAFSGWRSVTLMGLPTGGGSGRSRRVKLANSGLGLRLSSMASFRPDGKLYELGGSAPDVVVKPKATDFIGRTDTQLEAAVGHLQKAKRK